MRPLPGQGCSGQTDELGDTRECPRPSQTSSLLRDVGLQLSPLRRQACERGRQPVLPWPQRETDARAFRGRRLQVSVRHGGGRPPVPPAPCPPGLVRGPSRSGKPTPGTLGKEGIPFLRLVRRKPAAAVCVIPDRVVLRPAGCSPRGSALPSGNVGGGRGLACSERPHLAVHGPLSVGVGAGRAL